MASLKHEQWWVDSCALKRRRLNVTAVFKNAQMFTDPALPVRTDQTQ